MRTVLFAALICVLCLAPAGAQVKPDFSGTWKEDETARRISPPVSDSWGEKSLPAGDTIIRQTPVAITIERTLMSTTKFVYALDGTESVNRDGAVTRTTRSRWDGGKLVSEGTSLSSTRGEVSARFREVRWLDATGAMIVETTHTDEAGKTSTVTSVFRRKREKR